MASRNPHQRPERQQIDSEPDAPVWVPGTFTEWHFRKALGDALNGQIVFSDSTPWSDLTRALLAIAVSPRPVPHSLVENSRAVYRAHAEGEAA